MKAQIPRRGALAGSSRHQDNGRPARALPAQFGSTVIGQRSLELCSMDRAARPRAAHRGRARLQSSCVLSVGAAADSGAWRAWSWCTSCSSRTRARAPRSPTPSTRRTPPPLPTPRTRRTCSSRAHEQLWCSDERRVRCCSASGRGSASRGLAPGTRGPASSSSLARARAPKAVGMRS